MATVVTKTVKASGGDYSSLSAFEAGEQRDLVSADEIAQAECYAFDDVSNSGVTFDGWTSDATRYVHVVAASGAEATSPLNTGTGYTVSSNGADNIILGTTPPKLVLERIQLIATSGASAQSLVAPVNGSTVHLIGCVLRGTGGEDGFFASSAAGVDFRLRNCIVYNLNRGIYLHMSSGTNTLVVYNNTVVDCNTNGILTRGSTGTSAYLKNNIVQGLTGNNYTKFSSYAVYDSANNISEDATSPDGASWQNRVVTFADEVSDDFHLASGDTEAKGTGADLSADPIWPFSDDFEGEARSTWDIGADGFVAAGGGTVSGTGSATLPPLGTSATGQVQVTGAGAAALPAIATSGAAGTLRISGSGSAAIPSLSVTGVGAVRITALGVAAIPALGTAATATGEDVTTADGAAILPALRITGAAGVARVAGAGAATLPAIATIGAARVQGAGAGAAALPALSVNGIAHVRTAGAGNARIPALVVSGVAIQPGVWIVSAARTFSAAGPARRVSGPSPARTFGG